MLNLNKDLVPIYFSGNAGSYSPICIAYTHLKLTSTKCATESVSLDSLFSSECLRSGCILSSGLQIVLLV